MARPRQYPKRTCTAVRFPEDLHHELSVAAEERDLSVNYLVNLAVRQLLDRLIPVEELKWTRD